ncbi:MAG: ABC transporter permease [Clostridia bacterium]|jgi:simple sugar transport system permease protein|nr:ABC transporter permease [Clostridia bacterium]
MLQILEQYTLLLQYTLIFSSVLLLVALGGCFSEHSGVINLGLEGIMVIGALGGALFMYYFQDKLTGFPMIALTVLTSVACGVLYSALLGVACINFKADQTIVGTALNMLGTAAATVIVKAVNLARDGKPSDELIYRLGRSSFIKGLNFGETNFEFNWFMAIAVVMLIVAYVVLYKTKFGLRLMSCGEHPQAAASVGISVYKMRWSGVLISGAYGGLGGICYIMAGGGTWHFSYGVAGFGFLSLAVMIFGQWKPGKIALAALLFGVFRALSNVNGSISLLSSLNLPPTVYNMLPYIVSLIVLAFTSKKSRAPKAEGIPYDKGQR